MKKTIKKLSAELDDNKKLVNNVGLKLSENNIPLNELGSLKMELNKAISENQRINDKIDEELDKNEKETVKRFIAGNIIGLIIFIMCLINRPLAVLFLLINARILCKNLFDVDYKSLQKMKTQEYEQKIKITRLKKEIETKTFHSKKVIDEKEWSGRELEAIFDNAVNCVEGLLSGKDIKIESPLLKAVVLELLKDDNYPNATISELVNIRRQQLDTPPVLKKFKTN